VTGTPTPSATSPRGEVVFAASATAYNWTVPANVYFISALAIGGGGATPNTGISNTGAGGGSLGYANDIAVTPGEVLTILSGLGGTGSAATNGQPGVTSYIVQSGVQILYAGGGGWGYKNGAGSVGGTHAYGGTKANGGGIGGVGGASGFWGGTPSAASNHGGGGGAGGYSGNGGRGSDGDLVAGPAAPSTAGAGGGGGGAGLGATPLAGGGVGIYGQGANGTRGTNSISGGAGSGGSGTQYGGGGGTLGGNGVVRIVWGVNRRFPSTDLSPEPTATPTPTPTPTPSPTPTRTSTPTLTVTSTYSQFRFYIGAGGGGAGSNGIDASYSAAGNGGAGILNTITGTPAYYAGGGGGGAWPSKSGGLGGIGGGGAGNVLGIGGAGTSGTANTGGGGGASSSTGGITAGAAGNGGSGIVVIKYRASSELLGNDPYFNKNIGLIHSDNTSQNAGNIVDVSGRNEVTINDSMYQGAESPHVNNGWAYFWTGSSSTVAQYTSSNAFIILSNGSSWAFETWFFRTSTALSQSLLDTNVFNVRLNSPTDGDISVNMTGSVGQIFAGTASKVQKLKTWHHLAITHEAPSMSIYIDGLPVASFGTGSTTYTASAANLLTVGRTWGAVTNYFNGYLSNYRISTTASLYTASFAPPRDTLSRTSRTRLLIMHDGTNLHDQNYSASSVISTTFDSTKLKLKTNPFFGALTGSYNSTINGSSIYSETQSAYITTDKSFLTFDPTGAFSLKFWYNTNKLEQNTFISGSTTSSLYLAYNYSKVDDWMYVGLVTGSTLEFITYTGTAYVSVGSNTKSSSFSTDGLNWSFRPIALAYTGSFGGIFYTSSILLAYFDFISTPGTQDAAIYSTDGGVGWTATNGLNFGVGTSGISIHGMGFGNGQFVAAGTDNRTNTPVFFTSTNGISWVQRTTPSALTGIFGGVSIAYGLGTFVIVSYNSEYIVQCVGASFYANVTIPLDAPTTSRTLYGVAYGNGIFIAVGRNSTILRCTDSGYNWDVIRITPSNLSLGNIVYADGLFVIGGGDGELLTSSDGLTWAYKLSTVNINGDFQYLNNKFFMYSFLPSTSTAHRYVLTSSFKYCLDFKTPSYSGSIVMKSTASMLATNFNNTIVPNTWKHIGVSKTTGSRYSIYIDGTNHAEFTDSSSLTGQTKIGPFCGYLSDFTVVSGSYDGKIPAGPETASTDTVILLSGTNPPAVDKTGLNTVITKNIDISNNVRKVGAGSMFFNGSSSYAYSPNWPTHFSASIDRGMNMTIESWINPSSLGTYRPIYSTNTLLDNGFSFGVNTDGKLTVKNYRNSASYTATSSTVIPTGSWSNVALTIYSGSKMSLWVNGTSVGSPTGSFISSSELGYQGTIGSSLENKTAWSIQISPTPGSQSWSDVAYGNGTFVAVASSPSGSLNAVMTSTDGITWTPRAQGAGRGQPWSSLAYGSGLFVAVSDARWSGTTDPLYMTSPDGINWTARSTPTSSLNSLTYGNGLFVGGTTGNLFGFLTSPDGINWTPRATGVRAFFDVVYGDGLFVAVSNSTSITIYSNRVMTSTDGITWNLQMVPEFNSWQSVAYGNGLYVAVANNGLNRIITSPDGINWTPRKVGLSAYNKIIYGNGLFVVFAGGTLPTLTSSDGINWLERSAISPVANGIRSATYVSGSFVVVGANMAGVSTNPSDLGTSSYFHGYMDEFRYTDDFCRYIGSYTPYKRQFQNHL
jgi:hypothetical protein